MLPQWPETLAIEAEMLPAPPFDADVLPPEKDADQVLGRDVRKSGDTVEGD